MSHKNKKYEEIMEWGEFLFHSRLLYIQPLTCKLSESQAEEQKKKAKKVVVLFKDFLDHLMNSQISLDFKIVLLKTLRHLISQLDFKDQEQLAKSDVLKTIW